MTLAVNQPTFKQEVLNSPLPVLVNFWAPWCGVCRLVDPMLSELQTQLMGDVKVVSINADENLLLASSFRLTTLPTIILLHQGAVLCRIEHLNKREEFRKASADLKKMLKMINVGAYSFSA